MSSIEHSRKRWIALAVIVAAQFMVVLDVAIVNVALPSIKTDLHFSEQNLEWVITAYSIVFGGVLLLGGRLADILGRRRLFVAGLALFTISSLLDGLAWSEGSLIAFRLLQGLGAALLSPAALSILTTTFREGRERNVALGVWGAASGSGAAAGVLLGGVLTSALGWSWIFFVNVPAGAIVLAVTPWLLRESKADLGHHTFDFAGAASITGGLMLLVYALTRATQHGWGTTETIGLLVASGALIVAFVMVELRSKAPLLPLGTFRLRTLAGANASGLLLSAALFSQFFLLRLLTSSISDRYSWSVKGKRSRGSNVEYEPDPVPAAESQEGSHDLDRGAASRRHGVDRLARREARERGDRAGRVWLKELARARAGQGRRGVPARRGVRDHRRVARPALA